MRHIRGFESFINESYLGGSRAPLYHTVVMIEFVPMILDEDKLKSSRISSSPNVISLTRDKNFVYGDGPVTFVLDQDKLKETHTIHPIDYFTHTGSIFNDTQKGNPKREVGSEFEEAVKGDINDLHTYLIEIRINNDLSLYKNAKPNTREQLRECYEDLLKSLIKYKANFDTKVVLHDGKEWTLQAMRDERDSIPVTENIYHKDSGNRMYVSKAADESDYKVYYSSYNPMGGFKGNANKFSDYLKKNGIEHSAGGNYVRMSKENVDKLKKSLLTLQR